jgi:hypothetical protein
MAICGAAIVTACAFVVWRASAAQIKNVYLRAGLAATLVVLPIVGLETLGNVTNSIWFLLFASFWVLLWRPATFRRALLAAAVVFLAAVSNAGIALFAPSGSFMRSPSVIAATARSSERTLSGSPSSSASPPVRSASSVRLPGRQVALASHRGWDLVPAYVQRAIGGAVTGQSLTGDLWRSLGTPFEIVLAVLLAALVVSAIIGRNPRVRFLVPLTVAISLATFLVAAKLRIAPSSFFSTRMSVPCSRLR